MKSFILKLFATITVVAFASVNVYNSYENQRVFERELLLSDVEATGGSWGDDVIKFIERCWGYVCEMIQEVKSDYDWNSGYTRVEYDCPLRVEVSYGNGANLGVYGPGAGGEAGSQNEGRKYYDNSDHAYKGVECRRGGPNASCTPRSCF